MKDDKKKSIRKVSGKEAFFTRTRANQGMRIPLVDPSTGEETDQWLHVIGRDSDKFRAFEAAGKRRTREAVKLIMDDPSLTPAQVKEKVGEALDQECLDLIAALVSGWSFPEDCTPENVVAFLKEAPQIATAIDKVAANRALFFAGVEINSTNSQLPTSDSTESQSTASSLSETPTNKSGRQQE